MCSCFFGLRPHCNEFEFFWYDVIVVFFVLGGDQQEHLLQNRKHYSIERYFIKIQCFYRCFVWFQWFYDNKIIDSVHFKTAWRCTKRSLFCKQKGCASFFSETSEPGKLRERRELLCRRPRHPFQDQRWHPQDPILSLCGLTRPPNYVSSLNYNLFPYKSTKSDIYTTITYSYFIEWKCGQN